MSLPTNDDTAQQPAENREGSPPAADRAPRERPVPPGFEIIEGNGSNPTQGPGNQRPVQPSQNQPSGTTTHRIKHDLRSEEVVKGSHPGDTFIRYPRKSGPFRRLRQNVLSASLESDVPRSRFGRVFNRVKRVLIGAPISSEHSIHERLTNVKALAILSSDALSSVAYATEEIMRILILAGGAALSFSLPLAGAVIVLMVIVVSSYRQTIAAYPRGGGTYIVAKDNLGTIPGLAAAASILIGYILTVAVSVAAGIAAIYSIFPNLRHLRVELGIAVVVFITIVNLRGLREAGNVFAVPTYLFIFGILAMIVYGLMRQIFGIGGEIVYAPPSDTIEVGATQTVSLLLLLRAFTQGSAALTGVEAIADGVPAFKTPEAKNARATLIWMGGISIIMFAGITYLASALHVLPSEHETVVSQIARSVFPPLFGGHPLWFFIQITTALILVLAANTAFADFPRLSYFMARDKFMPRQYAFRGDKLAFSWGIITLAALACILIVAFNGDTSALIPLYAIGVMSAFTFSQSGMVMRWWRTRPPGWWRNLIMNGVGATVTLTVFLVATLTKLEQGTWLVIVLIPILMGLFLAINRHYTRVEKEVEAAPRPLEPREYKHTFIVPVASLNSVSRSALAYARSLSQNVTAVHISEGEDPEEAQRFNEEWQRLFPDTDINLVIIESPYRSLIGPLLSYIDALDQQYHDDTITIVLPETIPAKPWEYLLHNQSALRLKAALLFRPNTVVADVPYLLGRNRAGGIGGRSPLTAVPWGTIIIVLMLGVLAYLYLAGR
ncbi:MAG TPA: APC family permease [Chloroflexia bacterium]|nr:APC family permease [Chloroflexia bacterium]